MSGHTSGPWYLVGYGRIIRTSEDGTQGDTVCVLDANKGETLFKNHVANGPLLAAAPDLLHALKYLLAVRNISCLHFNSSPDDICAKCIADAAIAKAEGL